MSEFLILPPQNATGNWVKVVDRMHVRIEINEPEQREKGEIIQQKRNADSRGALRETYRKKIDISNLAAGVYIIQIEGEIYKFIIK